jgi:hypothetical protein
MTVDIITSGWNWFSIWMCTELEEAHTLNLTPRNKSRRVQTAHCVLLKLVTSHTKEFQNCSIFRHFCSTNTLFANQPLFLICARGI